MRWGRWSIILGVTAIITFVALYEWPKLNHNPKKDKFAFISLLLIGWILAMFDLPNISGPITWLDTLFKPFEKFLKK